MFHVAALLLNGADVLARFSRWHCYAVSSIFTDVLSYVVAWGSPLELIDTLEGVQPTVFNLARKHRRMKRPKPFL